MIKKTTDLGNIDISTDVIATICGGAATECYGVVGMASQKMMDGFSIIIQALLCLKTIGRLTRSRQ